MIVEAAGGFESSKNFRQRRRLAELGDQRPQQVKSTRDRKPGAFVIVTFFVVNDRELIHRLNSLPAPQRVR